MVYTQNRYPTKVLNFITLEEAWNERQFCIADMRVFGCVAYTMVFNEQKGKLDAKGTKCMFLSYCKGTNDYRLMYPQTKKIIKNRIMAFMEDGTSV